jgi:hypothetical protein
VQLIPVGVETLVFLEPYGTLITGDRIIGDGQRGLRRCPQPWSELPDAELRSRLLPVLSLPVSRVLVSHGESLFSDAGPALRAAVLAEGSS